MIEQLLEIRPLKFKRFLHHGRRRVTLLRPTVHRILQIRNRHRPVINLEVQEVICDQILGLRTRAVLRRLVDQQTVARPGQQVAFQTRVPALVRLQRRHTHRQLIRVLAVLLSRREQRLDRSHGGVHRVVVEVVVVDEGRRASRGTHRVQDAATKDREIHQALFYAKRGQSGFGILKINKSIQT